MNNNLTAIHRLLKVHKNENFSGFDFEFCTIECQLCINKKILVKKFFDWTIIGGATRNEKNFLDRPNFFLFFKSYVTPKYLLIIDFPKFNPLTAADGIMWKSWAKMSKFIPLSLRLSGIEFTQSEIKQNQVQLSLRLSRIREYKNELNLIPLSLRLS